MGLVAELHLRPRSDGVRERGNKKEGKGGKSRNGDTVKGLSLVLRGVG